MDGPNFQMCNLILIIIFLQWHKMGKNPSKKELKVLTIIFRMSGEQCSPVSIQCLSDDKMKDTINKFCTKAGGNKKDYNFLFNAKQLLMNSTVEENGLANNSNIFFIRQKEISKKTEENNNNNQNIINNNLCLKERFIYHLKLNLVLTQKL